jgi:hypothetical protein
MNSHAPYAPSIHIVLWSLGLKLWIKGCNPQFAVIEISSHCSSLVKTTLSFPTIESLSKKLLSLDLH